jgi:hypothetical protein
VKSLELLEGHLPYDVLAEEEEDIAIYLVSYKNR